MRVVRSAAVLIAAAVAGCAAPHQIADRSDYVAEATRSFAGESRERVLRAAETVLRISDPNDWEFRYTLTGFTGTRRYFIYLVLAMEQGRDKWEFQTEEVPPNTLRASVSISKAGTAQGGYSTIPFDEPVASIPLYRLFWARMDYLLGRRPDWVTCEAAAKEVQASNTSAAALSGLCGVTSEGRSAPPPPPLPPQVQPIASAKPPGRR